MDLIFSLNSGDGIRLEGPAYGGQPAQPAAVSPFPNPNGNQYKCGDSSRQDNRGLTH
jgi:hypothetical protein